MLDFITEQQTVWEYLSNVSKPIVLYGTGNGAEKILDTFAEYGIVTDAVFASDDFVRGQIFHGYRVEKLEQIKQKYSDFIIVTAFGFGRPELVKRVAKLSKQYELYAPHMPVVGKEPVDFDYLNSYHTQIEAARELLADNESRAVYDMLWNYRISGKITELLSLSTPKQQGYRLVIPKMNDCYLDLGAYDGDTIREIMHFCGGEPVHITAIEPDARNYRKLKGFTDTLLSAESIRAAIGQKAGNLFVSKGKGRGTVLSIQKTGDQIPIISIDDLYKSNRFTLIKFDVEGQEEKALEGGKHAISQYRPRMIVAAYHRNEDLFSLVQKINQLGNGTYKIYLRQHPHVPAWDTNLYVTTEEC